MARTRTEEAWAAETEYILSFSLISTPKSLAKRRRVIEQTAGRAAPLHLLPNRDEIVTDADCDEKPEKYRYFGAAGSPRPLAMMEIRAWIEWYWFRGRDPFSIRRKIPRDVYAAVLERDWPICQLCGGVIALGEQHLDHIIHYARGGEETVENLRLTHDLCNIRRGAND